MLPEILFLFLVSFMGFLYLDSQNLNKPSNLTPNGTNNTAYLRQPFSFSKQTCFTHFKKQDQDPEEESSLYTFSSLPQEGWMQEVQLQD
jgi:hypothetical protein